MNDDLLPVAKAVEELEPAVQALADATGLFGPVRELAMWATDLIRYQRVPFQAKLLMRAAKKVEDSGCPPCGVEDKLLRAVLEDGAMEDDASMQERWANLLANAITSGTAEVRRAFPGILSEIEPAEATWLDAFADEVGPRPFFEATRSREKNSYKIHLGGVSNMVRLGLLDYMRRMPNTTSHITDDGSNIFGVKFTTLGWLFVQACREPRLQPGGDASERDTTPNGPSPS